MRAHFQDLILHACEYEVAPGLRKRIKLRRQASTGATAFQICAQKDGGSMVGVSRKQPVTVTYSRPRIFHYSLHITYMYVVHTLIAYR